MNERTGRLSRIAGISLGEIPIITSPLRMSHPRCPSGATSVIATLHANHWGRRWDLGRWGIHNRSEESRWVGGYREEMWLRWHREGFVGRSVWVWCGVCWICWDLQIRWGRWQRRQRYRCRRGGRGNRKRRCADVACAVWFSTAMSRAFSTESETQSCLSQTI